MDVKERLHSEEELRQLLDDFYPEVIFGDMRFSPSQIIEELDPIAFRTILLDMGSVYQCGKCGSEYENYHEAVECCTGAGHGV